MKIYCILCDSIPLGTLLETYLQNRNFHHFTQVSNCFSTTSIISLLTGKMPSDLEDKGIGYHTHFQYKVNGKIDYPWKEQLLIHQLYQKGWDIHFHNANWFYLTICNDEFIKKTTSMPVKVEDEEEFKVKGNYSELLLNEYSNFYKNEKEFIHKIQTENSYNNKFYFIKNNQYHQAILDKANKKKALELIEKWFSYWDFQEEDTLFWIFSDHHNFRQIDKLCKAPSILTWALIKNNTPTYLFVNTNYIHIGEFYRLIKEGQLPFNKDRIYFSEDARLTIDPLDSTTAVACKFVNWSNNKAYSLIQVTYFRPENKYYGFFYNLDTKHCKEMTPDAKLKEALRRRFSWIK